MSKKKIFIIEDDQTVQEMLKMIFEKAGYEIEISSDGQSIYKERDHWPDLFVLDKQLFGFRWTGDLSISKNNGGHQQNSRADAFRHTGNRADGYKRWCG